MRSGISLSDKIRGRDGDPQKFAGIHEDLLAQGCDCAVQFAVQQSGGGIGLDVQGIARGRRGIGVFPSIPAGGGHCGEVHQLDGESFLSIASESI